MITAITREQLVDQVAQAIFAADLGKDIVEGFTPAGQLVALTEDADGRLVPLTWDTSHWRHMYRNEAAYALPVAVGAVLARVEALHGPVYRFIYEDPDCLDGMCYGHVDSLTGDLSHPGHKQAVCRECDPFLDDAVVKWPCSTHDLVAAIRAEWGEQP